MNATDERKLSDALYELNALGCSLEIAEYLRSQGFTGSRMAGSECPVAAYLTHRLDADDVTVSSVATYRDAAVRVPLAVAEFTRAFDLGAHSELDVESTDAE